MITREEVHALLDRQAALKKEWDKKIHDHVRRLHEEEGIAHSVMEIARAQTIEDEPKLYDELVAVALEVSHAQQDVELDRLESEKQIAAGWQYMMERNKRFEEQYALEDKKYAEKSNEGDKSSG